MALSQHDRLRIIADQDFAEMQKWLGMITEDINTSLHRLELAATLAASLREKLAARG